jgi:predicted ATP-dependent protease
MIPETNVQDLMLSAEVADAVGSGRFHVYAVRTIDEGIELLTGVEAGTRAPDGSFPPGSVNGRVEARLQDLAMKSLRFRSDS